MRDILHRLGTLAEPPSARVEHVVIIFRVIRAWVLEDMQVYKENESIRQMDCRS